MDRLGDGLKKIMLAGIGALAVTGEKSQEIVESLVKKGEITVEQGKVLNQELKHNIKSKVDDARDTVKSKRAQAEANLDRKDVINTIRELSIEQFEKLKEVVESLKEEDAVNAAAEAAEEVAAEAEEAAGEAAGKVQEFVEEAAGKAEEAVEAAAEAVQGAAEEAAQTVEEAVNDVPAKEESQE